jgi:glycosyltransferase involved in cell wall biosynthesis|tara:strand:+ start:793 stop:1872 length:1080 start_codon:yes stop_codon:yes gene_type:complete
MILIDGFHAGTGRGVGNYVDNILFQMENSIKTSKRVTVVVRRNQFSKEHNFHNIKIIMVPSFPFPIWENIVIPLFCWFLRPSILHSPCNSSPLVPIFSRRFLTLHDVIFLHGKDKVKPSKSLYQRIGRLYLKINLTILSRFYFKIFTVSDFSRNEIISKLPVLPERVVRIYEGAGSDLKDSSGVFQQDNTVIHFGSDDPRKNTLNTVKAFQRSEMARNGFKLIVIGSCDQKFLINEMDDSAIKNVDFKGFVSKSELVKYANSAFCLCYCSIYEGFGMPIIEFQEIGVPVITSDTTSCSEVCGDGGILVDPMNINSITHALDSLFLDRDLYQATITAGYKNIRRFSWEKCTSELVGFYER